MEGFIVNLCVATLSWVGANVQADCRIPAASLGTRNFQEKLVPRPWMALMELGPEAPPVSMAPGMQVHDFGDS
jgi:hypothetical protein